MSQHLIEIRQGLSVNPDKIISVERNPSNLMETMIVTVAGPFKVDAPYNKIVAALNGETQPNSGQIGNT